MFCPSLEFAHECRADFAFCCASMVGRGIAKKRRGKLPQRMPNGKLPIPSHRRFKRLGERLSGRPHDSGYDEAEADSPPADWTMAVTAGDRPSLLRCVWRGMYLVRGSLGEAARDELHSHVLCDTVYKYTSEGSTSIYKHVNNTLALKLKGREPKNGSGVYLYTARLVMAVRLLFDGSISRVYRGVAGKMVNVEFYRRIQRQGLRARWNAFASTSRSRDVALRFAGEGGVLFVISRSVGHAAAADISALSQGPNAQEVLLLPMQVFIVEAVHMRETYTEIVLSEVPYYPGEI